MSDSLSLDEPPQPQAPHEYRVLARKYRPQTFGELIGQDAMVTTLGNAIQRGRLAHAFLLTGVRGVGKTSTARLIAKALNCIGPDEQGGPTIDPCGTCEPCRAIAEGRHIDVIEMDAASHTGIDDVREIIEAVRYASVSARFKIYIIDEVHMLSKQAFNGLLKTLEEPPAHVKFLFATTEVNKVPVTVLSRCQRFDLRRITPELLTAHFAMVADKESVPAEPEALGLIARAAEGSARDGLSLLDQAIAHAGLEGGGITAAAVREMLGLSDRSATRDLLALLLAGDGAGALGALRRQYDFGVDPQTVLRALLEAIHGATVVKLGAAVDAAQSAEERQAYQEWATQLSFPVLHRLWQLLLKGHDEVARAAMPIEAAEMALLRVVHASSLPDPGELLRKLEAGMLAGGAARIAPAGPTPVAAPSANALPTNALPGNLAALADLLADNGRHALSVQVTTCVRPVSYAPPELTISTAKPIPADLIRDLTAALKEITSQTWKIAPYDAPGEPTLAEARAAAEAAEKMAIMNLPVVQAALAAFPEAVLESWPKNQAIGV